ncbi:LVIS_2131 family protein [Lacticaseibacillus kribbianus]|uniref:LVIS_2131 family protein n=1 Tax=Lacticaseibacillus kribbianus TaxID=2926292 RepID=UPI001CD39DBB|nr:LVIS_2131 family protein [Lacticaseibacillus kribbianus]
MWNLIGVAAWALVICYLIAIVMNIRRRHLRMLVLHRKNRAGVTLLIDLIEVVVLIAATYGMAWVTWLRPTDYTDAASVKIAYTYGKLVIQPDATRSYYVTVKTGTGKDAVRYYTYWTEGAKTEITSRNADIASGTNALTLKASAYPWDTAELATLDRTSEKAWVATMRATYKPTFLNGLGMHVGHQAQRFDLIRVPNETVIKVLPLGEDE